MRIVGGKHRGRPLAAPGGRSVRPTSDRVRQAVFDILCHWALTDDPSPVNGAQVLDICCGTGAMGLEALSRGAAHCTFIDADRSALAIVRQNAAALGEAARADVRQSDAASLPRATKPASLIFLDPPYRAALVEPVLTSVVRQGWAAPDAIVVVETARADSPPDPVGFVPLDERLYGTTRISVLARSGNGDGCNPAEAYPPPVSPLTTGL